MIKIVDRTFNLLEFLAKQKDCVSNQRLAAEMGITIQCANNLLRTLYQRGYVAQDQNRNYRLGARCIYIGSYADRWSELRDKISQPMQQLVKESALLAFAGVIENDKLLCISILEPGRDFPHIPQQSWYDELHSTACGRVLLSALSAKERKRFWKRYTRRKMTDRTIVSESLLEKICCETVEKGYSEVRGESIKSAASIAVPVFNKEKKVCAALALSGANVSWNLFPLEHKLKLLHKAAQKIRI